MWAFRHLETKPSVTFGVALFSQLVLIQMSEDCACAGREKISLPFPDDVAAEGTPDLLAIVHIM